MMLMDLLRQEKFPLLQKLSPKADGSAVTVQQTAAEIKHPSLPREVASAPTGNSLFKSLPLPLKRKLLIWLDV